MTLFLKIVPVLSLFLVLSLGGWQVLAAAPVTDKEDNPLIDDLSALKKEVLQLNRDLFILEEDLLYPSSTQLNIYVSNDKASYFLPHAVELKVDGQTVQSHLYTELEKATLARGGVQKLYQGNVKNGEHLVVAIFTGKGPENREYRRAVEHTFKHEGDPISLELTIKDQDKTQQPEFAVRQWQP